jgi:DNA adenine methylase
MRTLIKWPGGKAREYKNIKAIIPKDMKTYIEPFFGGGGIYFNHEPEKSIINDINENLMAFYRLLKEENKDFKKALDQIADDWDNLSTIAKAVFNDTKQYKNNISELKIREEIDRLSKDNNLPKLINGQEKYWGLLAEGLIDKLRRIIGLEVKNGEFSDEDFYAQIVAVTKGAYYYYLRDKFTPSGKEEEVAQFFFIREYCFGSMFRFNSEGKFNIPYGGASYNDKSFHTKIDNAFSLPVANMLKNTDIYCLDFREFLKTIDNKINESDFCFFDPPYDTEFSEYDKQSFGKKDQEDLANLFGKLKCRGLMIIKKTDFIYNIYKEQQRINPRIVIDEYGKNYSYNVRGRNEREVTHLLILNYKPTTEKQNVQLSF